MADVTTVLAGDEPLGTTYLDQHTDTPTVPDAMSEQKQVQPSYINETVLKDKDTHPAYMDMLRENQRIVGGLGLVAMLILGLLSWFGKTVPDVFATVPYWAVIILGVLLVGDALLGKLAVKQ